MRYLVLGAFVLLSVTTVHVAETWDPRAAATYLDQRQEQWSQWPRAQSANGACVSCHTGMTYLIARPALRRVLGESDPTKYEHALIARLRTNVGAKPPAALRDVEVIFAALFLARQDAGKPELNPDTEKAFEQLWTLQSREGETAGSWKWYQANLDPWEMPESIYYGASLAALAVGHTPASYRARPEVRANIDRLVTYLNGGLAAQPLHNRIALLWASSKLPAVLSSTARERIIGEIFSAQDTDGSWTVESLGPWKPHPDVPGVAGSRGYTAAFTTFALQQAGVRADDERLVRALDWLRRHQNRLGYWPAESMNKSYPDGSMERLFMRDAATAFAAAALAAVPSATQ